ncbi:hypothetical protein A3841_11000 [Pontibacter flavimaris]|uniref:Uncharacterized protein n=1 Tax=Pontibacter flavimaris TaxID=1797110 RepID=A0A1Q5PH97_9BACT|nr:hypothetical protein A3841_11000 [Pontibacter flavimaris]
MYFLPAPANTGQHGVQELAALAQLLQLLFRRLLQRNLCSLQYKAGLDATTVAGPPFYTLFL